MHFLVEVKVQKYYNIVEEVINMTLKELRLSKELTQSQVAKLVGISLRSYKEYENDVTKINTLKYNYIFNELSKILMLIIAIYLVAMLKIMLMN